MEGDVFCLRQFPAPVRRPLGSRFVSCSGSGFVQGPLGNTLCKMFFRLLSGRKIKSSEFFEKIPRKQEKQFRVPVRRVRLGAALLRSLVQTIFNLAESFESFVILKGVGFPNPILVQSRGMKRWIDASRAVNAESTEQLRQMGRRRRSCQRGTRAARPRPLIKSIYSSQATLTKFWVSSFLQSENVQS